MERVIAYVDGFNLFFGMRSKGWRRYYWLDPTALASNLLKPRQALVSTKYFTARISDTPNDPGKAERQNTYLEAIDTRPEMGIYYGHYLPKPQRCFRCGSTWISHEEKMTDVNMAVEMLKDAFADQFDTALLLSADSDLTAQSRRYAPSTKTSASSSPVPRTANPSDWNPWPTRTSGSAARSSKTASSLTRSESRTASSSNGLQPGNDVVGLDRSESTKTEEREPSVTLLQNAFQTEE